MFTRDELLTIQLALHVATNTSPMPAKWRDYIELGDKISQLLSESEAEGEEPRALCVHGGWADTCQRCKSLELRHEWFLMAEGRKLGRIAPELCTSCVPFAHQNGPVDHEPSCSAIQVSAAQSLSDSAAQGEEFEPCVHCGSTEQHDFAGCA